MSGTSRSPVVEQTSGVTSLPPELRNQIYGFVVIKDWEISIKLKRPAITQVCRQARHDSLSIFLTSNNFVAYITKHDYEAILLYWLEELMSEEQRRGLTKLTVACYGELLIRQPDYQLVPELRPWHRLIVRLRQTGVTASQLVWPGLEGQYGIVRPRQSVMEAILEKRLFNRCILTPLLHQYHLLSTSDPPRDVFAHIKKCINSFSDIERVWETGIVYLIVRLQASLVYEPRKLVEESVAYMEAFRSGRPWSLLINHVPPRVDGEINVWGHSPARFFGKMQDTDLKDRLFPEESNSLYDTEE